MAEMFRDGRADLPNGETSGSSVHKELRVAAGSAINKVAGSIVKNMEEGKIVSLSAMGAGAVNQAVKAICLARGWVAVHGWNLYVIPGMIDEYSDDVQKTAIRFLIKRGE